MTDSHGAEQLAARDARETLTALRGGRAAIVGGFAR